MSKTIEHMEVGSMANYIAIRLDEYVFMVLPDEAKALGEMILKKVEEFHPPMPRCQSNGPGEYVLGGLQCTRPEGHDGQHEAPLAQQTVVWSDPAPPAPERPDPAAFKIDGKRFRCLVNDDFCSFFWAAGKRDNRITRPKSYYDYSTSEWVDIGGDMSLNDRALLSILSVIASGELEVDGPIEELKAYAEHKGW